MRERKERSKALKSENLEGQPKNVNEKELDEAIAELDALVGLSAVKDEVKSLCNLIKVRQIRLERGLRVPELSQHLVFSGKPGTGKTTVARIIGRIYHSLGFLSKGQFVEADRSKLVAGYVGQTALKTQDVITQALGGVLFIDEAYSLSPKYKEDFGAEAIETILKAMEDHRDDFVVIVAGYDELMEEFITSNPGLQSRFKKYIHFQDYKGDELLDIFLGLLEKNNYGIDINVLPFLSSYFEKLYLNRTNTFGNARDVRNLFEKVIEKQANRIVQINAPSDEDLLKIKLEDFGGLIK